MFMVKNKGSVYDTASAQVIQVVNMNVSPGIIPTEIDSELQVNYPNYEYFILFGLKTHSESFIKTTKMKIYTIEFSQIKLKQK